VPARPPLFQQRAARSLRTFNPVTCKPRQPGTAEMPESQARPIITVVQHKSGMWARSLNQAEREMFERLQCALASCQFTCMAPQLQSTITCPNCGYQATEVMPTDACVALYDCNGCGETLKPIWFANPLTASHSRQFFSALRGRAWKRQAAPPRAKRDRLRIHAAHHLRARFPKAFRRYAAFPPDQARGRARS